MQLGSGPASTAERHGTDAGTACNVTYDEVGAIVVQPTATGQRQLSYLVDGSVRTITDTLGSAAQFRYDARYGDKLGSSIEWLRNAGKSWDDIIESATRAGGKDLGF